jgi:hypothetical protein
MVHWTENELMEMFGEMKEYWDNEDFWDQVMIGYTDLERSQVWIITKSLLFIKMLAMS